MRYFLRFALGLLLFIQFFPTMSQDAVYSTRQFTISDGLSSNSVVVIYQDSKGFLWIGTQDGLNRYDGSKFDIFRFNKDLNSISGNYILAINEDKKGNIWIGTRKGGLSVYSRATGVFNTYMNEPGNLRSLPENDVLGFYISPKGEIWVKTENYLSRYYPDTDDFTNYGHFSNLFKRTVSFGYPIVYESDTSLLVGTKDGINRFLINQGTFERLFVNGNSKFKCSDLVSDIIKVGDGLFLAATHSGLRLFEPSVNLLPVAPKSYPGSELAVNAVYADKRGRIWVGTKKGLEKFRPENMVHEIVRRKPSDEHSVVPYEVASVIEDASGLIWVGTRFNGLFKLSTKPPKFSSIAESDSKDWPLRCYNIQSVYFDNHGKVWMGTLTSGVYVLDRETRTFRNFTMNKEQYRNEDDAVYSIFKDDNGQFWFGTNSGVYIIGADQREVEEFNYGYDAKYTTLLKNNQVMAIVKDKTGALWFGTHFGLYRYLNGRILSFFKEDHRNLLSDEINVLLPDNGQRVWIGTGEGLCYYDLRTGLLNPVTLSKPLPELNQQVLSLEMDQASRLWVGTRSGMFILEEDSASVFKARIIEGLKDEMVSGILVDRAYRVWLSSGKGISFLTPDESLQNFDVSDGIPGHVFNQGSVFKSPTGELFFGSVSGLCWINPDSISYNLHRPRIAITGISICIKGDCHNVFYDGMSCAKIKYRPGMMMEVNFAALEYTHPGKNHFRIMLEGYDKDWRPVTKSNQVTFSNIMPGEYKLKIIASNNDLTWNTEPLEFPLIIDPPLWMTGYAYAFYLLVIVFVIQMFVNYRIRHYRKANRTLTEKTQDKKRIEAQRETLSRINQSLTDSISYATRIQSAMIPTEKRLKESLPKSFVYFRPRDMVSGDFYYVFDNGVKTYIAVVDCTGHGVPGAFMSIIGMDLLKSVIEGRNEENPARILEIMNVELERTLNSDPAVYDEGLITLRDGMDMGLCVIDHQNGILDYAGAVNELYLIRNNEILTYKGNRYPLGRFTEQSAAAFDTVRIMVEKNDMIYLFSDGYVDQFGGPDMKKFKYRRFRHLLLNIHQLSSDDQKAILHQKLEEWKGENEQVDDIIILGFRPSREI